MKRNFKWLAASAVFVCMAPKAFAAENPFSDVPLDHWSYAAVAQLAADGVIEGYGDGTYRGEQEITRYEMAQMVARAMAKGGGDKALIDKLAAEYADELHSLGVRVSALEKKVDNVKWGGVLRYRYKTIRVDGEDKKNSQYVTLRLEPEARINEHWVGKARMEYNTDMDTARNSTGRGPSVNMNREPEFRMNRAWVEGTYGNTVIRLGKF